MFSSWHGQFLSYAHEDEDILWNPGIQLNEQATVTSKGAPAAQTESSRLAYHSQLANLFEAKLSGSQYAGVGSGLVIDVNQIQKLNQMNNGLGIGGNRKSKVNLSLPQQALAAKKARRKAIEKARRRRDRRQKKSLQATGGKSSSQGFRGWNQKQNSQKNKWQNAVSKIQKKGQNYASLRSNNAGQKSRDRDADSNDSLSDNSLNSYDFESSSNDSTASNSDSQDDSDNDIDNSEDGDSSDDNDSDDDLKANGITDASTELRSDMSDYETNVTSKKSGLSDLRSRSTMMGSRSMSSKKSKQNHFSGSFKNSSKMGNANGVKHNSKSKKSKSKKSKSKSKKSQKSKSKSSKKNTDKSKKSNRNGTKTQQTSRSNLFVIGPHGKPMSKHMEAFHGKLQTLISQWAPTDQEKQIVEKQRQIEEKKEAELKALKLKDPKTSWLEKEGDYSGMYESIGELINNMVGLAEDAQIRGRIIDQEHAARTGTLSGSGQQQQQIPLPQKEDLWLTREEKQAKKALEAIQEKMRQKQNLIMVQAMQQGAGGSGGGENGQQQLQDQIDDMNLNGNGDQINNLLSVSGTSDLNGQNTTGILPLSPRSPRSPRSMQQISPRNFFNNNQANDKSQTNNSKSKEPGYKDRYKQFITKGKIDFIEEAHERFREKNKSNEKKPDVNDLENDINELRDQLKKATDTNAKNSRLFQSAASGLLLGSKESGVTGNNQQPDQTVTDTNDNSSPNSVTRKRNLLTGKQTDNDGQSVGESGPNANGSGSESESGDSESGSGSEGSGSDSESDEDAGNYSENSSLFSESSDHNDDDVKSDEDGSYVSNRSDRSHDSSQQKLNRNVDDYSNFGESDNDQINGDINSDTNADGTNDNVQRLTSDQRKYQKEQERLRRLRDSASWGNEGQASRLSDSDPFLQLHVGNPNYLNKVQKDLMGGGSKTASKESARDYKRSQTAPGTTTSRRNSSKDSSRRSSKSSRRASGTQSQSQAIKIDYHKLAQVVTKAKTYGYHALKGVSTNLNSGPGSSLGSSPNSLGVGKTLTATGKRRGGSPVLRIGSQKQASLDPNNMNDYDIELLEQQLDVTQDSENNSIHKNLQHRAKLQQQQQQQVLTQQLAGSLEKSIHGERQKQWLAMYKAQCLKVDDKRIKKNALLKTYKGMKREKKNKLGITNETESQSESNGNTVSVHKPGDPPPFKTKSRQLLTLIKDYAQHIPIDTVNSDGSPGGGNREVSVIKVMGDSYIREALGETLSEEEEAEERMQNRSQEQSDLFNDLDFSDFLDDETESNIDERLLADPENYNIYGEYIGPQLFREKKEDIDLENFSKRLKLERLEKLRKTIPRGEIEKMFKNKETANGQPGLDDIEFDEEDIKFMMMSQQQDLNEDLGGVSNAVYMTKSIESHGHVFLERIKQQSMKNVKKAHINRIMQVQNHTVKQFNNKLNLKKSPAKTQTVKTCVELLEDAEARHKIKGANYIARRKRLGFIIRSKAGNDEIACRMDIQEILDDLDFTAAQEEEQAIQDSRTNNQNKNKYDNNGNYNSIRSSNQGQKQSNIIPVNRIQSIKKKAKEWKNSTQNSEEKDSKESEGNADSTEKSPRNGTVEDKLRNAAESKSQQNSPKSQQTAKDTSSPKKMVQVKSHTNLDETTIPPNPKSTSPPKLPEQDSQSSNDTLMISSLFHERTDNLIGGPGWKDPVGWKYFDLLPGQDYPCGPVYGKDYNEYIKEQNQLKNNTGGRGPGVTVVTHNLSERTTRETQFQIVNQQDSISTAMTQIDKQDSQSEIQVPIEKESRITINLDQDNLNDARHSNDDLNAIVSDEHELEVQDNDIVTALPETVSAKKSNKSNQNQSMSQFQSGNFTSTDVPLDYYGSITDGHGSLTEYENSKSQSKSLVHQSSKEFQSKSSDHSPNSNLQQSTLKVPSVSKIQKSQTQSSDSTGQTIVKKYESITKTDFQKISSDKRYRAQKTMDGDLLDKTNLFLSLSGNESASAMEDVEDYCSPGNKSKSDGVSNKSQNSSKDVKQDSSSKKRRKKSGKKNKKTRKNSKGGSGDPDSVSDSGSKSKKKKKKRSKSRKKNHTTQGQTQTQTITTEGQADGNISATESPSHQQVQQFDSLKDAFHKERFFMQKAGDAQGISMSKELGGLPPMRDSEVVKQLEEDSRIGDGHPFSWGREVVSEQKREAV